MNRVLRGKRVYRETSSTQGAAKRSLGDTDGNRKKSGKKESVYDFYKKYEEEIALSRRAKRARSAVNVGPSQGDAIKALKSRLVAAENSYSEGQFQAAEAAFTEALPLEIFAVYAGLASSLLQQGKVDEAQAYFQIAAQFPKGEYTQAFCNNYGALFLEKGECALAKDYFKLSFEIDPTKHDVVVNYALCLIELGEVLPAYVLLDNLGSHVVLNSPRASAAMARALNGLGDEAQVIPYTKVVKELGGEDFYRDLKAILQKEREVQPVQSVVEPVLTSSLVNADITSSLFVDGFKGVDEVGIAPANIFTEGPFTQQPQDLSDEEAFRELFGHDADKILS